MKVFITGGRGMVGRNFMEHSAGQGHEIIALGRGELDLSNFDAVLHKITEYAPDVVVHAAGRVGGIQANISSPVSFLIENLDIGRNVVLASHKAGVRKLLNLGSSCMYPHDALNPLKEESILTGALEPTNEGYALAKIMVARLCEYIAREDPTFQYKTLVPCNIYGRHDKFDPKNSHMVPAVIHKIHTAKLNGLNQVDIWGSGKARREFMYAGDLSECMWRALENFNILPAILNVGVGTDLSISDYYEVIARVIGYSGKFVFDLTKPEGMTQKLVSVSKLDAWGWRAVTPIDKGIAETYQFYLERYKS